MKRSRAHRDNIRQIDAQQLARDQVRGVFRQIMHSRDDRVRRYYETPPRGAVDEGGVIDEPEPARPREWCKETPDSLKFSELVCCHRPLHLGRTQCATQLVEDAVREPRLFAGKKRVSNGRVFVDRDAWWNVAPMHELIGAGS